jgi:outer membrane receptor for ferrienterochelin and colicin
MRSRQSSALIFVFLLTSGCALATVFGTVRGIVHDASHRPVEGAVVKLHAAAADYQRSSSTSGVGEFEFRAVPVGEYRIEIDAQGFATAEQSLTVVAGAVPVVHIQLRLAGRTERVEVVAPVESVDTQSATPATLVSRAKIRQTPGADLSNSFSMITDYVPGAYMTHDQLHVRGGHQVTWAIDGVPIPNTNIASNVGPQIDPKDIDYLEIDRGGYSSEYGDRTYGVFNVVPRTGFERNGEIGLNTTYGSFHETNDQLSFGDHSPRLAYFASINGNRSDYGLSTPGPAILHDRVWGLGGFGSIIFNKDAVNQFRFVTSVRRDDYQIPNGPDSAGTRDVERERDAVADFTWVRVLSPNLLLTVAPFVHFNRANYDGDPNAMPVSATQHLDSTYAGAQMAVNYVAGPHNARAGIYGFGQHDQEFIALNANDGSGAGVAQRAPATGHLEAAFAEDQFKVLPWVTVTGGIRATHFTGAISENAASPRIGLAIRIPRLNWTLRGFYGRYYQAPPLSTVSGPLLDYAVTEGLGVIPLRGERDEENQVGIAIPLRGWTFDVNSFRQRATNYFDHNAIGNSNVFFPISIAGARIRGTEVAIRSPRVFRRAEISVAYAYLHSEGEGAITGGLTDFSPPESGWFFLDHDQRHTLHTTFNVTLPQRAWISGNIYYGSGFTDGESDIPRHLQPHTTFDLSAGKDFGKNLTVSLTALNAGNRRFLLDNSLTFGGTHYADPRQIYGQVRYRFHR